MLYFRFINYAIDFDFVLYFVLLIFNISDMCDKSAWVDIKEDCGGCRALINKMNTKYITCENYCSEIGMTCINAWEEKDQIHNCFVEKHHTCQDIVFGSLNKPSVDVICECKDDGNNGKI